MNFNLKRPCADCPFLVSRKFPLHRERQREIALNLLNDLTFTCHKTNTHCEESDDMIETRKSEHCAGALIALEKIDRPNQLMRISERLGMYDRRKLDMTVKVISLKRWAYGKK